MNLISSQIHQKKKYHDQYSYQKCQQIKISSMTENLNDEKKETYEHEDNGKLI